MNTPRPRRFHRVCHCGHPGSTPPRLAAAPPPDGLARPRVGRSLLCAVLVLAGSGPVWSAGKAVVELYRDDSAPRPALVQAVKTPRVFSRQRPARPTSLFALSDVDGSLGSADETSLEGASLELANGGLPREGEMFSRLNAPATDDRFSVAEGGVFPVNEADAASPAPITGTADFYQASTVPEPGAWTLLALGTAGTLVAAIRRRLR